MKNIWFYNFLIGKVGIAADGESICQVFFSTEESPEDFELTETPVIKKASEQLTEYFDGRRKDFDLPLKLEGTTFQKAVWQALLTIPAGETRSYKDIAILVGNPGGSRAVGMANNRNPVAVIVPCHRVIGQDGSLTGYAGGLSIKQYLLNLEKIWRPALPEKNHDQHKLF